MGSEGARRCLLDLDQNPPVCYLVIVGNLATDAGDFREITTGQRQAWSGFG